MRKLGFLIGFLLAAVITIPTIAVINIMCEPPSDAAWVTVGYSRAGSGSGSGWNSGLETDTNCKAWWKFNDGELTTDSKGTYTLTAHNSPTADTSDYKEGDASAACSKADVDYFDRTGTTNDFGWADSDAFTVCGWVKLTALNVTKNTIFAKSDSGKSCIYLMINPDGYFYLQIGYNNGDSYQTASNYAVLSVGNWYFFSVGYQDSDRSYFIHILDSSLNTVGTDKTDTFSNAWAGQDEDGTIKLCGNWANGNIDGKIDELVVFDTKKTISDVDKIAAGTY